MKKSTVFQLTGGLLIAGVGLYIFFRDVNPGILLKEIRQTKYWIILVSVILNPLSLWFRALRWELMLPSRPDTVRNGLFPVVMIGFMFNNIFPARIGEAARAVLLWKKNRFTVMESVGLLLIERFIDTLMYASFSSFLYFLPVLSLLFLSMLFLWLQVLVFRFSVFLFICVSLVFSEFL